jgi:hypothetical protein
MPETSGEIRRSALGGWRAAAAIVAVIVPAITWITWTPERETRRSVAEHRKPEAGIVAPVPAPPTTRPTPTTLPTPATRPTPPTPPSLSTPVTPPTVASTEFIPLVPMTEQELAGSFQLVRVQMPRASLGALRSPLEHPDELVEADVLLGVDGMARAIRVPTGGSVYPWRSR